MKPKLMKDPVIAHDEYVNDLMANKMMHGAGETFYIPELMEMIGKTKTKADRIKILRNNASPALKAIFLMAFDENIVFNFKRKDLDTLDYKPMDIPDYDNAPITLFTETRRLLNYTNRKQGTQLSKEKSLKLIGETLSALHANDVEVVKQMVTGKFAFRGLTRKLIEDAFPDLLPTENSLPFNKKEKEETDPLPSTDAGVSLKDQLDSELEEEKELEKEKLPEGDA